MIYENSQNNVGHYIRFLLLSFSFFINRVSLLQVIFAELFSIFEFMRNQVDPGDNTST